jgi:hypothetical protein
MRKREHSGTIYWRMWVGVMLVYGVVILATDFSDDWPVWLSAAFGLGMGLIFDAAARVAAQVHAYARDNR